MSVESRVIADRKVWLEDWRPQNINCSEIPAIYGRDRFKTRLRLWAEKRGVEFPREENSAMRRGRWMEPAVAEAVSELRPEWRLERARVYYCDAERRIGGTPDYFIDGDPRGRGVLQCKTVNKSIWRQDWTEGEACADSALYQNFPEVMLAGAAFGAVAVLLVDGYDCDCRIFDDILPNEATWQRMQETIARFWREVESGTEPTPDYERDDRDLFAQMRPRSTPGKSIDLSGNNRMPAALAHRAELKRLMKAMQAECDGIEAELADLMGDAEAVTGVPGWKITFKSGPRAGWTVPPKENVRTLRITDQRNGAGSTAREA